jgi:hypothetical protein
MPVQEMLRRGTVIATEIGTGHTASRLRREQVWPVRPQLVQASLALSCVRGPFGTLPHV